MAITRTWEPAVALDPQVPMRPAVPSQRRTEVRLLLAVSLIVAAAIAAVVSAKTADFRTIEARLRDGTMANLNQADPAALNRLLEQTGFRTKIDIAHRLPLRNVGALRRDFGAALPKLKPYFVVRTASEFWRELAFALGLYFAGFYAVHFAWRLRRFAGDGTILPVLHLLTGVGLVIALSIRDPLRDTFEFSKFSVGVAIGCALLLLPLFRFFDYRRYAAWIYTPLLVALALSAALLVFGSGPTGSDSKVNLGAVQPMELVKILLVLFMAGYFARRWEWLRELRQRKLPRALRWANLPRFEHAMPVLLAVGMALLLFFALRDLGPALVVAAVFATMYAIARSRSGLALAGILVLVLGVALGYGLGKPATVAGRISMWLSPWNNDVRGGDQLVHSTWAFSTGGPFGSGPGRGDPAMIPAGHTDLVLPAFAEEWGLPGVLLIAAALAFLFARAVRIALRAPDEYGVFLGLGIALLIGIEMLLISAGVLGAMPLTGIVSPFLSSGNSAMLANFLVMAILIGISSKASTGEAGRPFRAPVRVLSVVLSLAAFALVARAVAFEAVFDEEYLARDVMVYQADGIKRPQHNPRLNSLAQSVVRGRILDRNGVVLASSAVDGRHYAYPHATAHLLGDVRTGENFAASNASLIEDDQNRRLRGFESYAELATMVRYRHQEGHPAIAALHARDRDVRTTIDIRLQQQAVEILERRVGIHRGALVVLDVVSGDALALASVPAPQANHPSQPDELLDRARYGQYPPGSTFKLVTAMAALRKNPRAGGDRYVCKGLGHGRVGALIPGWNRPIRDDAGDPAHGRIDLARALTVSCNAYFAQLGVFSAGSQILKETADLFDVPAGDIAELKQTLPFASMGQGHVLMTPFKLARITSTIAADGLLPQGRWLLGESNDRTNPPRAVIPPAQSRLLAAAMRSVVTSGTARRPMAGLTVQSAGKTGTAQTDSGPPHAWFTAFAPYDAPPSQRIAVAVVVEHGGYGARAAAPIARDIIEAAQKLGIIAKK